MSRPFPLPDRPRLWGVAVSHYQVEGGDPCDWSEWEAAGRTRGGACGDAVDSWHRYEDDAALAASIGSNAFRFSISWSRVEPEPGRFDEEAIERYVRFVRALREHNLEPIATLFHYTHPRWFHRWTPWTSSASVDRFVHFATRMGQAFGNDVRIWTIFNEPLVFLLAGFIAGEIPPGLSDAPSASRALENIFRAHALASIELRRMSEQHVVGVAHNMIGFAPERRWHPLDQLLTIAADRFYNRSFLRAFIEGEWRLLLPPGTFLRGKLPELRDSLDFIGVNFYSRLHLRSPGRERLAGDFRYLERSAHGLTENGWEIVPEVFEAVLHRAAKFGLPLMVTENGIADASDEKRRLFLRSHFEAIRRVEASGTPIHGYLHWSLLDNFEWLDGYGPRFGLCEVDRATMQRRPRPSAELFKELGREFLASP